MEQYYDYNHKVKAKDALFTPLRGVRLTGGLFRQIFDNNLRFTLGQLFRKRGRLALAAGEDAVEIAVNTRKISTSLIQRKLSIGYGKAAKFIDIMEDMGIVGEANGSKPREVLLSPDEWHEKLARTSYD